MRKPQTDLLGISGDAVVEDARVNSKGGSRAAILRKQVTAEWGPNVTMAKAARLDFGRNVSAVFLAPQMTVEGEHSRIEVTRVSDTRFVLDLRSGDDDKPGPLEAGFLQMVMHQFKEGKRGLVDQEEAMSRLNRLIVGADE